MKFTVTEAEKVMRKLREINTSKNRDERRSTETAEDRGIRAILNNIDCLIRKTVRGNSLGIQMISRYEGILGNEEINNIMHECPSRNPNREMSEAILAATSLTPQMIERIEMAMLLCSELFDDRDIEMPMSDLL